MIGTYCVVRFSNWLLNHRVGWGTRVGIVPPDSSWNLSFTICIILTSLRRAGGPVVSRVGWIVLHSISFDIWPNIRRGMGKHKGRLWYKGRSYLISSQPSPHWGPSVSIHVVCWSKWKYSQSSFIPILGQSYELLITSLLLKPWQPCALLFQLSANLDF